MRSVTAENPPVLVKPHVSSEVKTIVFPIVVVDSVESEKAFTRRAIDAERRYEQLIVSGNSRKVAEASREIDKMKIEAREKGFSYKFKY